MIIIRSIVLALSLLLPSFVAFAQVNTSSTQGIIQSLVRGGAGPTVNAVSSGVVATSNGTVLVNASGLKIPVPVSVAANVARGRIAAAALGCTNPIGVILCASAAAALAKELRDVGLGYGPCPNGTYAFICKSAPATYDTYHYVYILFNTFAKVSETTAGICAAYGYTLNPNNAGCDRVEGTSSWYYSISGPYARCLDGSDYRNVEPACGGPAGPPVPASDAEMGASLQTRMDQDFAANKRLYDALKADQDAAEKKQTVWPDTMNPIEQTTPVTVTAPPVTAPERTVSTETKPLPDGSTETTVRRETTVVSPTVTGTPIGDVSPSFPSTTTVTTSTTNNTTNITNTTTTTINNPSPEKTDHPDDYARENTLQKVVDSLDTTNAPTLADQSKVVTDAKTQNQVDIDKLVTDAKNGVAADKSIWFSWVWSAPVGTCAPFAGNVHGYSISFDLCPTIMNIRDVLGWLLGMFSAWTVYGQMFRKEM